MTYFIFIDESGQFDEGITKKAAAVVGGVCGTLDDKTWEATHLKQLDDFNRTSVIKFSYPTHYHCGKLLDGKLRVPGHVTPKHLDAFAANVFKTICESCSFVFASKNPPNRFECSPQATYVLNLIAALRTAIEQLATHNQDADALEIVVAQRTITETTESRYPDYMPRLLDYVHEQLLSGDSRAIDFVRRLDAAGRISLRWGIGDRNGGLIAADFVSCLLRGGRAPTTGTRVVRTSPDEVMFGNYRGYSEQEVRRLLNQKQYATAADVSRRYFPAKGGHTDFAALVQALRDEQNGDVLIRELPALLSLARFLINQRTQEPGSLDCAKQLLNELVTIAENALTKPGDAGIHRAWAGLLVDGLADLAACHNHLGSVGPQADVERRLETVLGQYKTLLPGSHAARRERLLDIRNRNLNLLFNDYRFEEVINVFDGDVTRREAEVPKDEPDELLGQMQGSIGQAYAFLARTDPNWTDTARQYFEKSVRHFQSGTLYHAMSVNYLATLAWQAGDLPLACAEMHRHPGTVNAATPADLLQQLPRILADPGRSAFDAVNYLRIAAAHCDQTGPMHVSDLKCIHDALQPRMTGDHPHEQLCKWLGYLLLQAGEYALARQVLHKGLDISRKLDFTVHTIGLSLLGLLAISDRAAEDQAACTDHTNECIVWATALAAQSAPFGSYMNSFDGPNGLRKLIDGPATEGSIAIARLLPFSYS